MKLRSLLYVPASSERFIARAHERGADAIIVDIHGEATSEKQAMGHFCDGRATLVVGTHTHAPTADLRVLAGGTAFMSDVGMTGDYDSVIGMTKEEPLGRFLRRVPSARISVVLLMKAPPLQGRGWGGVYQDARALPDLPHPPTPSPEGEGDE